MLDSTGTSGSGADYYVIALTSLLAALGALTIFILNGVRGALVSLSHKIDDVKDEWNDKYNATTADIAAILEHLPEVKRTRR